MRLWNWTIALTVGLSLPALTAAQQAKQIAAGYIEEIRGKAYWRPKGEAKPTLLHPQRHKKHPLRPGEQVRCDKGGRLVIRLHRKQVVVSPSSWYTIPKPPDDKITKAISSFARPGGRLRNPQRAGFVIVSPPSPDETESGLPKVHPQAAVIRWTVPDGAKGTLTLELRDSSGAILWREADVPCAQGKLDSAAFRQALQQYRAQGGNAPLQLNLTPPAGKSTTTRFALLSEREEQALQKELQAWANEPGLLRHIGRAWTYERFGLLHEVAEECEQALKLAPHSEHLLKATAAAQGRTGNWARVRELLRRLNEAIRGEKQ